MNKHNIKVEEIANYHIYPIADNNMPRLSADRFENTLSGGLYQIRDLNELREYLEVQLYSKFN